VTGLAANPDGSLWVGIADVGRGLDCSNWRKVSGSHCHAELDGSTLQVEGCFLDRENALWIGTYKQGIYRIHGRNVDHFRSGDGLSSDDVYEFYEDHEANFLGRNREGIDLFP